MKVIIGGKEVHIGGAAKGSGMIHPNMATMLSVVTSDVAITAEVWRGMFRRATDNSFNAVSGVCSGTGPHVASLRPFPSLRHLFETPVHPTPGLRGTVSRKVDRFHRFRHQV